MSALPKQVRNQVEKSNQLAAEYYASLQGTPPASGAPPAGEPPSAAPVPPAGDPPVPGSGEPPAGDPAAPPASLPPTDFAQQYRALQGKYNAEVPRLNKQVKDQDVAIRNLQDQLTATQNLLASLSQQRQPAQPPTPPPAPAKLVTEAETKEFGADLIDVMRRVVREEQASLLPEIDRRVAPVVQQVRQVEQHSQQVGQQLARNNEQTVLDFLDEKVPEWKVQNKDPGFLEWLGQPDPYSGHPRGQLLQQAYTNHDGPRVVAFFKGYQREHATVTPPAPPAALPAAPQPPAATQKTLNDLVAPGTPKSGAASTQDGSGKRVWSTAEIGAFYASLTSGKFRGTAEQRKALEADIFAAQRENRVR